MTILEAFESEYRQALNCSTRYGNQRKAKRTAVRRAIEALLALGAEEPSARSVVFDVARMVDSEA